MSAGSCQKGSDLTFPAVKTLVWLMHCNVLFVLKISRFLFSCFAGVKLFTIVAERFFLFALKKRVNS